MHFFKLLLLITAISLFSYFLTTTIVDVVLMGRLDFYFSTKARAKDFLITKANWIDFQDGFKCSGFSSAFVMVTGTLAQTEIQPTKKCRTKCAAATFTRKESSTFFVKMDSR